MPNRYRVIADHAEFNREFSLYREAMDWLTLVRVTLGSNAEIVEAGASAPASTISPATP